ncbi:MAG TPA: RsmB/NOP family class I SAM-dependent RNA methyltransferase [Rhodocyclaceae bacterium]|nr:RsmB/NOP family class I SAM-dependent RNA methyltransferase [Rhodocyclaceae bacterium]
MELLYAAVAATSQALMLTQPADGVLSAFFRTHKSGGRDRAFIAETVYAVLRHKRWLERLAGVSPLPTRGKLAAFSAASPRELVILALVRVRGFTRRQYDAALSKGEHEWLAALRELPEPELSLAEQLDFPDWLTERLAARMSAEDLRALAQGLNNPAPLDLRVNLLKASREDVLQHLQREGLAASPCAYAPHGIRLKGKPSLQRHPLFLDGQFEVQDEGSQLLAHLVAPKRGEMIVDFCAGAGGKTLSLGALMRTTGRLYAFDVVDKRLAKLKPRAARAGLSNVHTACLASETDPRVKRLAGKIDRVLVDAPCSGLGTLRRNPDLKWRQTPQSIAELIAKQAAILASASRLLKPGGRLVYATCSILREENEDIVDAFLAAHPNFHRLSCKETLAAQNIVVDCEMDMHLSPHRHGTDGFYAAVLEKAR